jgi:NAD(P)-dependent dehydrogenase (short-subunit alcohol dehydrogenase family)
MAKRRSEGRVALITGGARGIGAATAERLAEDGAAIAIADLDGAGAEATAKQIAAAYNVPAIDRTDVSRPPRSTARWRRPTRIGISSRRCI